MQDEFRAEYLSKWEELIKSIFNGNVHECYDWKNISNIVSILNTIVGSDALNHTFLASGGGLDLISVTKYHEEGCIEINFDGLIHILKPKKLMIEYFSEANFEWAYFRIVADNLQPSDVYENHSLSYEEVTELSPNNYVKRTVWDANEFNGQPLPSTARLVIRILNGDLVIFNKATLYNKSLSGYDGRYSTDGIDEFRAYIKSMI